MDVEVIRAICFLTTVLMYISKGSVLSSLKLSSEWCVCVCVCVCVLSSYRLELPHQFPDVALIALAGLSGSGIISLRTCTTIVTGSRIIYKTQK